jgi:sulfite reductase alpha subunit-like flavoprotein
MKGILILFIDPADGGALYARNSEQFYNPKITKVSTTLDGVPNQLFASGMRSHQQFEEIKKNFADGKHRTLNSIINEAELADVVLPDYLISKFGLWLDLRTTDDNSLHGSGRRIKGNSQSIQVEIEKKSEADETLDAYVYYISDGQLNFDNGRLINVVY